MTIDPLPLELRHAIESGRAVLFLGAGIGHNATNATGDHMPTGWELAEELCVKFGLDPKASNDLAKVSQVVENKIGRAELDAFISKRLADFEPDDSLQYLVGLTWRAIFTTNYDRVIERCYELAREPRQIPVPVSSTSSFRIVDPHFEIPIYHLHGAVFDVAKPQLILTQRDYATFRTRRKMLFEVLQQQMSSSIIVYVGYSHNDPNWTMVFEELLSEFSPSPLPQSFRVTRSTPDFDREILNQHKITTLDGTVTDFASAIQSTLGDLRVDPRHLDNLKGSVPSDLHIAFENNAAATVRLLSSWTYVNQAPFSPTPNVSAFLRGEKANWSLIAGKHYFDRDVETQVSNALFDYATATKGSRQTLLLLGPAGYGMTTILMSLAVTLVEQDAGPVFMHKAGTPLLEGDIVFAESIFGRRPFFVIDDASNYARHHESILARVRLAKRHACFLLGERRNEWKQLSRPPKAVEFEITPLSDAEIDRLLTCLDKHGELGRLADLSLDLRVAAVKKKHDSQLLVVLREATEGKAFDAIIESEYRKLPSTVRPIYGSVACAYQVRQPLRDGALANVVGKPITEVYNHTKESLDGVVEYDLIDSANGVYAARCRHHIIAQIVWERCVPIEERESIMLTLVRSLNLTSPLDERLFETLVQSDITIQSLRSFDTKTRFFEDACKKQPGNGFIRQHYARMLMREDRLELALTQVDSAIAMTAKGFPAAPLHHTRGMILSRMMADTIGMDIARRRLVQAESAFETAIDFRKKDGFAYHGLATLYLDWAKRCKSQDESLDYASRAEKVVKEALRHVHDRERLMIVSSDIEAFLGNDPKSLAILEKAASTSVGVYMLGRLYSQLNRIPDAIKVIEPVHKQDPTDERLALLYAKCLYSTDIPLGQVIAILRVADLYGLRDTRFIAMMGGLYFLDGQYTEASKTFSDAYLKRFPLAEQQAVTFRPHVAGDLSQRLQFSGKVSSTHAGFVYIRVPGFPVDIMSMRVKIGKDPIRRQDNVKFAIGFNAVGPLGEQLEFA